MPGEGLDMKIARGLGPLAALAVACATLHVAAAGATATITFIGDLMYQGASADPVLAFPGDGPAERVRELHVLLRQDPVGHVSDEADRWPAKLGG